MASKQKKVPAPSRATSSGSSRRTSVACLRELRTKKFVCCALGTHRFRESLCRRIVNNNHRQQQPSTTIDNNQRKSLAQPDRPREAAVNEPQLCVCGELRTKKFVCCALGTHRFRESLCRRIDDNQHQQQQQSTSNKNNNNPTPVQQSLRPLIS